jgi:cellulose synthase/poly-beta-1,6-N-acetylglucosamine synthase-like glycosyltransferase
MTLQGITAASVTLRLHSMCNGANIAYTKEAFDAVGGFAGIDQLPTGDDMLLMHKMYKQYPQGTRYWLKKEALVTTIPPQQWRDFFNQRIRWASKAAYYEDRRIFWVLLLVYIVNCWMLLLFVLPWLDAVYWPIMLVTLLAKVVIELVFLVPVATFFEKTKWLVFFPLMQPLHIIYTVVAGWLGFAGSYSWKGRTTTKGSTPA